MIKSIRHKGLKLLATKGDSSKLIQTYLSKIKQILLILNNIEEVPRDLELYKQFRPHPYKGVSENVWCMDVSGNWRITFVFKNGHVYDVDLLDPH